MQSLPLGLAEGLGDASCIRLQAKSRQSFEHILINYIVPNWNKHEDMVQVGRAAGAGEEAGKLVNDIRIRLRSVARAVAASSHRPRVLVLSRTDPLCLPGWWLPDMLCLAGGYPCMHQPSCPPHETTWDQVPTIQQSSVQASPAITVNDIACRLGLLHGRHLQGHCICRMGLVGRGSTRTCFQPSRYCAWWDSTTAIQAAGLVKSF